MKVQPKGLKPIDRPLEDQPELPAGLSDVSDKELMTLLSEFTSWAGYAGYLVAEAEIEERKAERKLQRIYDRLSLQLKEKTVAATKSAVQQQEEFIDAEDELDVAYAVTKLTKSHHTHLEACGKTVSRELSRRLARNTAETRNDKYNA